jgi:DNA-directed RNA polymerase III subunit RPC6
MSAAPSSKRRKIDVEEDGFSSLGSDSETWGHTDILENDMKPKKKKKAGESSSSDDDDDDDDETLRQLKLKKRKSRSQETKEDRNQRIFMEYLDIKCPNKQDNPKLRQKYFGNKANTKLLVHTIQALQKKGFVQIVHNNRGEMCVRIPQGLEREEIDKCLGLDNSTVLIYNEIKCSGKNGISEKDIKKKIIGMGTFPKFKKKLAKLIQCGLIKSFKAFQEPLNKCYVSFRYDPPKERQGGFWFAGSDDSKGDQGAMENMERILKGIAKRKKTYAKFHKGFTAKQLEAFLRKNKLFKTDVYDFDENDIKAYLEVKVYDRFLLRGSGGKYHFMFKRKDCEESIQYVTHVPCGVCPVQRQCTPGGVVSPNTCEYMAAFLDW